MSGKYQHVDFSDVLSHILDQKRNWAFLISKPSYDLSTASSAELVKLKETVIVAKNACKEEDKQYWQIIINTIQGAEWKLKQKNKDPEQLKSGESGYRTKSGSGSEGDSPRSEFSQGIELSWLDDEEGMWGNHKHKRRSSEMREGLGSDYVPSTASDDSLPELDSDSPLPSFSDSEGDSPRSEFSQGIELSWLDDEEGMWGNHKHKRRSSEMRNIGDGTYHASTDPDASLPPTPSGSPVEDPLETDPKGELPPDPVLANTETVLGLLTHIKRLNDNKNNLPSDHWHKTLNEVARSELHATTGKKVTSDMIKNHIEAVGKKLGMADDLLKKTVKAVATLGEGSKPPRIPKKLLSTKGGGDVKKAVGVGTQAVVKSNPNPKGKK